MNVNNLNNHILDLVKKDELEAAINLLHELFKGSSRLNEVIVQSSQLTDLMHQIRNGTINFNDAQLSKNKIRVAILSLSSEIEDAVNSNKNLEEELNRNFGKNYFSKIQQIHKGTGDNIGRDKIVNN